MRTPSSDRYLGIACQLLPYLHDYPWQEFTDCSSHNLRSTKCIVIKVKSNISYSKLDNHGQFLHFTRAHIRVTELLK
jgi:hypothetical protein